MFTMKQLDLGSEKCLKKKVNEYISTSWKKLKNMLGEEVKSTSA